MFTLTIQLKDGRKLQHKAHSWIEVTTAKGKQLVKSEHTAKERAKQFLHKLIREGITINGERITWSMIESHSLS